MTFDEFWDTAVPPPGERRRRRKGVDPDETPEIAPSGQTYLLGDQLAPANVVCWPRDANSRKLDYSAIIDSKEAWRRAYERSARPPSEEALARIDVDSQSGGGLSLAA